MQLNCLLFSFRKFAVVPIASKPNLCNMCIEAGLPLLNAISM